MVIAKRDRATPLLAITLIATALLFGWASKAQSANVPTVSKAVWAAEGKSRGKLQYVIVSNAFRGQLLGSPVSTGMDSGY